ncbi:MAG: hypothetical protein U0V74_16695 [Chitinophagales bacterium]
MARADARASEAKNFFKRESGDIIQYARNNGDIVRYDAANNIFGVAFKDGTIRTMFKPDNTLEYFKSTAQKDLGSEATEELTKLIKN